MRSVHIESAKRMEVARWTTERKIQIPAEIYVKPQRVAGYEKTVSKRKIGFEVLLVPDSYSDGTASRPGVWFGFSSQWGPPFD